jgi:hypothetical protein
LLGVEGIEEVEEFEEDCPFVIMDEPPMPMPVPGLLATATAEPRPWLTAMPELL